MQTNSHHLLIEAFLIRMAVNWIKSGLNYLLGCIDQQQQLLYANPYPAVETRHLII
jgi:hypothetical protein